MNRYLIYFSLLASLFLLMCKPSQRVTKANLAYQYLKEPTIIHPVFKIYHKDDMTSTMYVRVKASEILYSKNNPKKEFLGKMAMQVSVFDKEDRKLMLSDTVFLFDRSGPDQNKFLLGEIDLDLPFGSDYLAEVTFDDLYRMQYVQDVLLIDKTDEYSEENYLIKNKSGEIQFGNTFDPGSTLFIETKRQVAKELTLYTYDPFDRLPPPPFSVIEDYSPSFVGEGEIQLTTIDEHHFEIKLGEAGIYHIPNEIDGTSGLTMLVFHSYYPYVKTVASMIRPMRFITTKQEYETLVGSVNLKKDVDDFWFKIAGNAERASEIVEEYYTRVEIANKMFTSYAQGWKTDRGLIYLIYGPPGTVTKNENYENWIYSEKSNVLSVEFNFVRIDNAFSKNDYVLNRSNSYKSSWYRAIDSWRQGRVY